MKHAAILVGVMGLALLSGCAERVEPYKCCSDLNMSRQQADLVVTGDVNNVVPLQHHIGPQVKTEAFGVIGSECVAEEQVTMNVAKVEKGNPPASPLNFRYNAPCFHPVKGFKLVHQEPSVIKGDKAQVYLVSRNGNYWMIAHELQNAPSDSPRETFREQLYTGDVRQWPE